MRNLLSEYLDRSSVLDTMTKYNEFVIEDNELGEKFTAEITDQGVYLEHNWMEGGLYIPHEVWDELDEFRLEFLIEIGAE